ncbi:unnamed protein product [Urochloa humidicola]
MARGGGEQLQTKTGSARHPSGIPKWRNSHERLLKPKSIWWKEEKINAHAMLLGCLLMSVRGLGFLMLTWITVVLLGGFVSNLGTVDFWSFSAIALLQIIGVFSIFHKWKYGHIGYFFQNLFPCRVPCCGCGPGCDRFDSLVDKLLDLCPRTNCCDVVVLVIFILIVAIVAVVGTVIYLLVVLVAFGIGIAANFLRWVIVTVVRYGPVIVAIWSMVRILVYRRLFFTSASDGPGMFGSNPSQLPNLTPAVDVAYWLGVAQGAVLLYRRLCYHGGKSVIKDVATGLGLESETATVRRYWQETAAGCEKNLAFVVGRNLMTYAVELLEFKSPDKFLPGIRILGTVIRQGLLAADEDELPEKVNREDLLGRLVLIKQLLTGSESFGHLMEELLQMLGPRSPYGMEIRGHAARTVLLVSHKIYLDEHPRCIQCVSSLLGPIEQHQNPPYGCQRVRELHDTPYERDWCLEQYERGWLVETYRYSWEKKSPEFGGDGQSNLSTGIRVAVERFIRETKSRSEPVDEAGDGCRQSYLQAEGDVDMVWLGLSILEKLAAADDHNCSVISSNDGLLPKIMAPLCCNVLHLDGVDHQAWGRIVAASLAVVYRLAQAPGEAGKTLIRSNISGNKDNIRTGLECILRCHTCPALGTAIELLTLLCMDASLGMQEATQGLIELLLNIFADGNCKENMRTHAGRKLALLSSQRAQIILTLDGILDSLKDIFLGHPRSTLGIVALEIMDQLCGGNYTVDGECHRNMKNAVTAVMPQVLTELFRCDDGTVGETVPLPAGREQSRVELPETEASNTDPDDIENQNTSSQVAASSFALKLMEMVEANMRPTSGSLRNIKLITKLVISLVTHGVRYVTEDMDRLMKSLTSASNKMMSLEGLMLCSDVDGGANKAFSTLCSLLKEAQELLESRKALLSTGSWMNN